MVWGSNFTLYCVSDYIYNKTKSNVMEQKIALYRILVDTQYNMVLKIKSYVYIVVFLSTVVPPSSKVSLSVVSVTCSQPHSKIGEYCKRRYFESKRDQWHSHNFYYSMLSLSYYIVINLLLCLIYTLYFIIYIYLTYIS